MSHKNIPIFIPHLGCPNQCVFCNQRAISECVEFREETVGEQIEAALQTIPQGTQTEIAFFGGSFTGIDHDLMIRLLTVAERYVDAGRVQAIRLSTRPDYINDEVLTVLSRFSVRTIELGLQSMDDEVLRATRRGHTAEQARAACRAIVDAGISLVGQMMIGLPMSDLERELFTAREICALGASAARIYPTVVFYDTPLCELAKSGDYIPITAEDACLRSAKVLDVFLKNGIPCIRIGLCATESLTSFDRVYAGPNHPALGEMVWNAYYYEQILNAVKEAALIGQDIKLIVPSADISKAVGQHRCNLVRIKQETDTRICKVIGEEACKTVSVMPWSRGKNRK